jgi:plastocyanin
MRYGRSALLAGALAITLAGAAITTQRVARAATSVNVTVGPSGMLVFSPAIVTAQMGDQVLWSWGSSNHSTTESSAMHLWDSGIRSSGSTFNHTFLHSGAFNYHCVVHVSFGMVGQVRVPVMITKVSATSVTIRWATTAPATGFVEDAQVKKPGTTSFVAFKTGTTTTSTTTTLTSGTWGFRARYRKIGVGQSNYSPAASIVIA